MLYTTPASQSIKTIQPGDFFLTEISGKYPKLIVNLGQMICGEPSQFSHAGIYLGNNLVLEGMPGGAQVNEIFKYNNKPFIHSYWDLTYLQRQDLVNAAWVYAPHGAKAGVGYSLGTYAAIGLHARFPKYNGEPLKNYISKTGEAICSQLVDQINLDAGLHMFQDNRWPGYVMPSSLFAARSGPVQAK